MSETSVQAGSLPKAPGSLSMIVVMTAVATACGLLIVTAFQATKNAIEHNVATITQESVLEILPDATRQIPFGVDKSGAVVREPAADADVSKIYAGYDESGALAGIAIEGSGQGWNELKILYAYAPDRQCIFGFKVLECRETPGVGDKIATQEEFLANFKELDATLDPGTRAPEHPIVTVKHGTKKDKWEIDAISGATISSKAVGRILQDSTTRLLPAITGHLDEIRKAGAE
ncbi:MAG: FMN-binding protein [Candidatus Hydrogenedentes bacterium]|nr:FMN-binding protein [Candidatus Hydrogenedentota bacterium]